MPLTGSFARWAAGRAGLVALSIIIGATGLAGEALAMEADCAATPGAYLRAEPAPAARVVTTVSGGRLQVLAREGNWLRVEVPGLSGAAYVSRGVCRALPAGDATALALAGYTGSSRTTVVAASSASGEPEKPSSKKKGGFWKKLGKGVLIGAVVAATAYAASKGGQVPQPPVASEPEEPAKPRPVYAAARPRAEAPSAPTYISLYNGLTGSRQRVGGFTYYGFSNGVVGSSQRVGNFTYHNLSNGLSGSSQSVGNFTYHNFNNGLSGSSQRVGGFTYSNYSNGVSGTSQQIGNFNFTNYSDGTSCTTQVIGSQSHTNCN